jgi:ParB family chromosome partitioning protein
MAANRIVSAGLSVREAEQLVQKMKDEGKGKKRPAEPDRDILRVQQDLADHLGTKVVVRHAKNGKGKIEIHYGSLNEFDGILGQLKEGAAKKTIS